MTKAQHYWAAVAAFVVLFFAVALVSPEDGTVADVLWLLGMVVIVAALVALVLAIRATVSQRSSRA